MSNSVDPDETAHFEPSHQDLHYLQKNILVCMAERVNGKLTLTDHFVSSPREREKAIEYVVK